MLPAAFVPSVVVSFLVPPNVRHTPPLAPAARTLGLRALDSFDLGDAGINFDLEELFADAVVNFAAIDKDGNGEISSVELRDHLNRCGHDDTMIDDVFSALGLGFSSTGFGSGMLTMESFAQRFQENEFLRSVDGLGFSSDTQELPAIEAAFDTLDTNSDGELSLDECRAQLHANGCTDEAVDVIFSTLDLNSDGGVCREEFVDACTRYSALRRAFGIGLAESAF